jgi:hypothetical protein
VVGVHRSFGLLAAALLGGCTIVGSDKPLFTAADSIGAPVLRPGLWAMPNDDCDFDETSPAKGWPDCANATTVTADRLSGGERGPSGKAKGALAYRIATGDPPGLQVAAPEDEKDGPKFIYAGLRPLDFDGQGRVTRLKVWLALCAKPPTMENGSDLPQPDKLPEGLEARPKGSCVALNAAAARAAIKRSEEWLTGGESEDAFPTARWVRDEE